MAAGGDDAMKVFRAMGLSQTEASAAFAAAQREGLGSKAELRQAWYSPGDGRFSRLAVSSEVKEGLMKYFEKEIGLTYGQAEVAPQAVVAPMRFPLTTRGGRAMGPWRHGF
mmetsp:Transcript_148115/g.369269  ORF Transcript_148115/g.369269 Transcript_148115/m.369269 type:complete len:111 (+) Transcript_148115:80-412(+)